MLVATQKLVHVALAGTLEPNGTRHNRINDLSMSYRILSHVQSHTYSEYATVPLRRGLNYELVSDWLSVSQSMSRRLSPSRTSRMSISFPLPRRTIFSRHRTSMAL